MRGRRILIMMLVALASGRASAQTGQTDDHAAMAPRFVDRINGLTLDQAIAEQKIQKRPTKLEPAGRRLQEASLSTMATIRSKRS